MNRAIPIKAGPTHVQRYFRPLLDRMRKGEIDPNFVISHGLRLDEAPMGYDMFFKNQDGCVKVVLTPQLYKKGESLFVVGYFFDAEASFSNSAR